MEDIFEDHEERLKSLEEDMALILKRLVSIQTEIKKIKSEIKKGGKS